MILVAGGTGTLGRSLVPLLLERGESVRVLTRGNGPDLPPTPAAAEMVVGDVRDKASIRRAMNGVRTVVSAINGFGGEGALGVRAIDRDGNANLIEAAEAAGVERFVLVSIHDASPDHPIELFRMKADAEARLRASGVAWTIVRPTAYMETWLDIVGRPLIETGRTRVFGRGRNPINFVSAEDVAHVVDLVSVDPDRAGATIEVSGPEDLTFDGFVGVVREVSGATGTVNHVPLAMLRLMSVALRPFKPVIAGQIAAAIVMDTRDMSVHAGDLMTRFPSIRSTSLAEVAARRLPATPDGPALHGSPASR